jgi:hypothetical protein
VWQADWLFATKFGREIGNHVVKCCMGLSAVKKFEEMLAERLVLVHVV